MIDVTNKKYELIDIGGDGKSSCLEDFCSELLQHSENKKDDEFSEEVRIQSGISDEDFYSKEIYRITEIETKECEILSFMANYTYDNHEWVRDSFNHKRMTISKEDFLSIDFYGSYSMTGKKLYKYKENDVIKFKPAQCLYKYGIIEKYIQFIYSVHLGDGFVWFGEYE